MKKCIILANGKPPRKSVINFFKKSGYNKLICADGGANSARRMNLLPDAVIGDLDSIKKENLRFFTEHSEVIKLDRQDDTDVEKCLKYAIEKGFKEAALAGVTGSRLDHTFCNLGIVIKFFRKIKIIMIAENSILIPYSGKIQLAAVPGEIISIYAFDNVTRITSSGLKYPLKNTALPFGKRESTSNVALTDSVKLKVTNGIIFVIRDFSVMRKNFDSRDSFLE